MEFERNVLVEAAHNFWANKWVVLLVVGLFTLLGVAAEWFNLGGMGIAAAVLWLPLAIAVHSTVLNNLPGWNAFNDGDNFRKVFMPFLGRGIGLSILAAIPAMLASMVAVNISSDVLFIIVPLGVYGFVLSLLLAKFGTILPACVAQSNTSIRAAGGRGSSTFNYVLSRIWAFNAPLMIIGFAGLVVALGVLSDAVENASSGAPAETVGILVQVGEFILLAFNVVLLATILSRAYLMAEAKKASAEGVAAPFEG